MIDPADRARRLPIHSGSVSHLPDAIAAPAPYRAIREARADVVFTRSDFFDVRCDGGRSVRLHFER